MSTPPRNNRLVKELHDATFQGIVVSSVYTVGGVGCVDIYVPNKRRILEKVPMTDVVGRDEDEDAGTINLEGKSLSRIVSEMLREYSMRPCLGVKEDGTWVWYSFGDIKQKLTTLSSYLGSTCPAHAYVCVVAENSLNYLVILFACMALGLTAVPLSMNFKLTEYDAILTELLEKGPVGVVISSRQDVLTFLATTRPTLGVLNIDDPKLFAEDNSPTASRGLRVASPQCPAPHSVYNQTFMRRVEVSPQYGWKCFQCSATGMGPRWACPSCPCTYCLSCKPVFDPDSTYVGVMGDSTLLVRISHQTGTGRYLYKNTLGTCTFTTKGSSVELKLASQELVGTMSDGEITGKDFKLVQVSKGGGRSLEARCPNGHALEHRVIKEEDQEQGYDIYFRCDLCDANIRQSEMGCSVCDYDICKRCLRNGKCPAGHPMIKSACVKVAEEDKDGAQLVCDECNARIDGSLYSCVVCDYDRCEKCKASRDTASFVLYTSGSSGTAKGAVIREDVFLNEIAVVEGNYSPTGATCVSILNSPISVSSTPYTLLVVLLRGGRLAVTSAKDNGFEIYREVSPTTLGLVPQIWGLLYKTYQADPEPPETKDEKYRQMLGHRLTSINCGGARPNREVMAWLDRVFTQCSVTENYAATETGPITFGKTTEEGWTPLLPDIKYKLINQTATAPFPKGELCVITPTMFSGYLNAKLPDVYTADGYYRTGDIVEVKKTWSSVYIRVIDRASFMFKLANGEWCSPETIESTLVKSEYVRQCFVHGDSHMDAVVCLAVLQEGVDPTQQQVLDDFKRLCIAAKLRACEMPTKLHLLPCKASLPLTDTSKLSRRKIRAQYEDILREMTESDDAGAALLEEVTKLITLQRPPTCEEVAEWDAIPWSSITAIQTQLLIKQELKRDVPVSLLLGRPSLGEVLAVLGAENTVETTVDEDLEVAKWSEGLPSGAGGAAPQEWVVLVTGASGFLGSAVVRELASNASVAQVYAVTRRDAKVEGKVVWVVGDLTKHGLGVSHEVVDRCNAVVHCGAEVNHMKNYEQLKEPNCGGTREVLKLADGKRLCFVSSISVLEAKDTSGYSTSKRVAERMVRKARKDAVVVRPGLLGPCQETGTCNVNDWFVRGLRSTFRNRVYRVNPVCEDLWSTPVDYAARYLLCLLFTGSGGCYNIPTAKTNLRRLYSSFEGCKELGISEWQKHLEGLRLDDPIYPFKESIRAGYAGCDCDSNESHLPSLSVPQAITDTSKISAFLRKG
eukprot:TRINITY_DN11510_c0_g1_i2.p1 TRINITY_DN11510_c0_g1~~TRINITY_DN11510_c0_g1_i2.p1  ORF type:complete len:1247 (+),score=340.91 TRINITY_DN11510_c0_g1_i2:34-3774(+)